MSETKPEYETGERPLVWGKLTQSSSKDAGRGYEIGYSDPTGDTDAVLAELAKLKMGVEALLAQKEA